MIALVFPQQNRTLNLKLKKCREWPQHPSKKRHPKKMRDNKPPGGSRKGSPNKSTKAIKDMILGALDASGGQKYLERQAELNPVAFMGLLGKIMPTQISGADDGTPISFVVNFPQNARDTD